MKRDIFEQYDESKDSIKEETKNTRVYIALTVLLMSFIGILVYFSYYMFQQEFNFLEVLFFFGILLLVYGGIIYQIHNRYGIDYRKYVLLIPIIGIVEVLALGVIIGGTDFLLELLILILEFIA
jgi:hypothetical protein